MTLDGTVLGALVFAVLGGYYVRDAMDAAMCYVEARKQHRLGYMHADIVCDARNMDIEEMAAWLQRIDYIKPFDQDIATYIDEARYED